MLNIVGIFIGFLILAASVVRMMRLSALQEEGRPPVLTIKGLQGDTLIMFVMAMYIIADLTAHQFGAG